MKELLRLQHVWKTIYNFFIIILFTHCPTKFPKQIPFPKTFTPHLYQRLSACTWKNRPVCDMTRKPGNPINPHSTSVYYHTWWQILSRKQINKSMLMSIWQSIPKAFLFFIISRGCFLPVKFTKAQHFWASPASNFLTYFMYNTNIVTRGCVCVK